MFTITINGTYTVNKAYAGTKKDGTSYALIKFVESENQPANIERPSKSSSAVNCWFESFPEGLAGVKTGDLLKLIAFDGVKWIHESYIDRKGETAYRDVLELVNAQFEKA